jgi:hypothetical protein
VTTGGAPCCCCGATIGVRVGSGVDVGTLAAAVGWAVVSAAVATGAAGGVGVVASGDAVGEPIVAIGELSGVDVLRFNGVGRALEQAAPTKIVKASRVAPTNRDSMWREIRGKGPDIGDFLAAGEPGVAGFISTTRKLVVITRQ